MQVTSQAGDVKYTITLNNKDAVELLSILTKVTLCNERYHFMSLGFNGKYLAKELHDNLEEAIKQINVNTIFVKQ